MSTITTPTQLEAMINPRTILRVPNTSNEMASAISLIGGFVVDDVQCFHYDVFVVDRECMVYVCHLNEAKETNYCNDSIRIDQENHCCGLLLEILFLWLRWGVLSGKLGYLVRTRPWENLEEVRLWQRGSWWTGIRGGRRRVEV